MRVLITHAYSRTNAGDGLLVDEAVEIVRAAFPDAKITLLALDPESFLGDGLAEVLNPLTGDSRSVGRVSMLLRGIPSALPFLPRTAGVAKAFKHADIVVAVGGGYLRASSGIEAVKLAFTQFVQLPRSGDRIPFVYLSQSVGPLRAGTRRIVMNYLRRADVVLCRDDRSLLTLAPLVNLERAADLALLGLPRALSSDHHSSASATGEIGLVARALPARGQRVAHYESSLVSLAGKIGSEPLAQATARGNNDPAFYDRLGFSGPYRSLLSAVSAEKAARPPVTVSVRLHGALQSIRAGVPSVHLSYERKGWGAFADLGLDKYVHNAFNFDVGAVADQAFELMEDASSFWAGVERSLERLEQGRESLVGTLTRRALNGAS